MAPNYGWTCPKCEVSHAPWIDSCDCAYEEKLETTETPEPPVVVTPDTGKLFFPEPSCTCSRWFNWYCPRHGYPYGATPYRDNGQWITYTWTSLSNTAPKNDPSKDKDDV